MILQLFYVIYTAWYSWNCLLKDNPLEYFIKFLGCKYLNTSWEAQKGVKWHFRHFSARSRLEKIAEIMKGAFSKQSFSSGSYAYFNASLVTSDWLSWPHLIAPKMLQQWHMHTVLVKTRRNSITLSEKMSGQLFVHFNCGQL